MPDIPELHVKLKADTSQVRAEFDALEAQLVRIKEQASGLGAWVAAEIQQEFAQALALERSSSSSEAEVAPAPAPASEEVAPAPDEAQPSLAEALASLAAPAPEPESVEQSANEGVPPAQ